MERNDKWLTVEEYAELMNLQQSTVRSMCKRGALCAEKLGGLWRIYYESPESRRAEDAAADAIDTTIAPCVEMLEAAIEAFTSARDELLRLKEGAAA